MYKIFLKKEAQAGIKYLAEKKSLLKKSNELIEMLKSNPYQNPPPYEKLLGDLEGCYSRRINIQHRLVYTINEADKTIIILSVWSHYEF